MLEHSAVVASGIVELADPSPAVKRRKTRGKYTEYTPQQRASIGKYACEHGNKRTWKYFLSSFPQLRESTIHNFKKAYKEKMKYQ